MIPLPNIDRETAAKFLCGWCGREFPTFFAKGVHEQNCEAMHEEMQKDAEREEERRHMENELWEEEHAAGRI